MWWERWVLRLRHPGPVGAGAVDDGWWGRLRRPGALQLVVSLAPPWCPPFKLFNRHARPAELLALLCNLSFNRQPGPVGAGVVGMPGGTACAALVLRYTTCGAYSIQQQPYVVQPRSAQVDCRLFSLKDFPD